MKTKIALLAALIAAAVGVQAQYSDYYYHRTGDTVDIYSEIAYYKWWDFEYMVNLRERITTDWFTIYGGNNTTMMATKYHTPSPFKVVGIAGCLSFVQNPNMPNFKPEYLYLFDATPNGPAYIDRSEIHFADNTPHRYIHLPTNYQGILGNDSCCYYSPKDVYLKLYECYFDSGIVVTDSFYVGWSTNNNSPNVSYSSARLSINGQFTPCNDLDTFNVEYGGCFFPCFDYIYSQDTNFNAYPAGTYNWETVPPCIPQSRQFALIYPIIQIDTTVPPAVMCDPVQNFSATVLDTGSGCVFFTWDDFYHYTYCEVQYYNSEQGYTNTETTTVTGNNLLHLCGLDTMLTYYARIRAYCDTSKIETAWTDWVEFTFPHTTPTPPNPPQGITPEPSLLDRFTHVMPNPAADRVMVSSELGLRRIEAYNARGILVYSEPAGYSSQSIDLRGWPAGQYMMTIETPQGKTAKRLIVAR